MAGLIRGAAAVVFPNSCPVCRSFDLGPNAALCGPCEARLGSARSAPACPRCAQAIGPFGAPQGRCRSCRDRGLRVGGTVRVAPYEDDFREVMQAFKYHGQRRLLPLLGVLLESTIRGAPWFERVEAVVPVPTHWRHRLGRPFYAAEALTADVAEKLDLPYVGLLRRVRAGPHQIGLSFTQRQSNVRGAFAMIRGARIERARVLLVDDVRTTGATLEECARVLLKAGCAEVYAAVAATAGVGLPTTQPIMV
jgi:ComF family protein